MHMDTYMQVDILYGTGPLEAGHVTIEVRKMHTHTNGTLSLPFPCVSAISWPDMPPKGRGRDIWLTCDYPCCRGPDTTLIIDSCPMARTHTLYQYWYRLTLYIQPPNMLLPAAHAHVSRVKQSVCQPQFVSAPKNWNTYPQDLWLYLRPPAVYIYYFPSRSVAPSIQSSGMRLCMQKVNVFLHQPKFNQNT